MQELKVTQRTVVGKHVAQLRRQGLTPGNLYGKNQPSVAVQVPTSQIQHLLTVTGHNDVIEVTVVDSAGKSIGRSGAMVRGFSRHVLSGELQHINLFRVSADDAVEVEVELVLVGEAPAVKLHQGTLVPGTSTITVKGPASVLPSVLEVDVSEMTDASSSIRVKDLTMPAGVEAHSDPEVVVATIVGRSGAPEVVEPAAAASAPATAEADSKNETETQA